MSFILSFFIVLVGIFLIISLGFSVVFCKKKSLLEDLRQRKEKLKQG